MIKIALPNGKMIELEKRAILGPLIAGSFHGAWPRKRTKTKRRLIEAAVLGGAIGGYSGVSRFHKRLLNPSYYRATRGALMRIPTRLGRAATFASILGLPFLTGAGAGALGHAWAYNPPEQKRRKKRKK